MKGKYFQLDDLVRPVARQKVSPSHQNFLYYTLEGPERAVNHAVLSVPFFIEAMDGIEGELIHSQSAILTSNSLHKTHMLVLFGPADHILACSMHA